MPPESRISLKNRYVAAVLAFLVPGAGHLYQGRVFKAALYFVCILGTFVYGMHLSEWQAVYYQPLAQGASRTYGFYAQMCVGSAGVIAIVQSKRAAAESAAGQATLTGPISAPFEGTLEMQGNSERLAGGVTGDIHVEPAVGEFGTTTTTGRLTGTLDGKPIDVQLGNRCLLGPRVAGGPARPIECDIVEQRNNRTVRVGYIRGSIPRPLADWFEAPLADQDLDRLSGDLGRQFEMALVYTWIAGLLNVLAIWDALEGPAYGYGDEEDEGDKTSGDPPAKENTSGPAPAGGQ